MNSPAPVYAYENSEEIIYDVGYQRNGIVYHYRVGRDQLSQWAEEHDREQIVSLQRIVRTVSVRTDTVDYDVVVKSLQEGALYA